MYRNDNSEAPTWVCRGPYPARRLRALKASHVRAAGGARIQARKSTGDVLGGLPPEKPRGLRDDPAQRQRTEMGRIRSCCQGWTGLDDCCKERGHMASGGSRGERKYSIPPGDAWASPIQRAATPEASGFVQWSRVRFCFVLTCCCCLHLFSSCDIP